MELLVIFLLTVLNGMLAMSEIAVVSARRARLQQQVEDGHASARTALELAESPNRFLATVQIGITLIGILAGAFGGATVANDLADQIAHVEALRPYSQALGVLGIVLATTYLSLVVGELVPKRLGMRSPERIAMLVAPFMKRLSVIAHPLVWLLSISTDGVLRLLGVKPSDEPPVTEEEINVMIEEGLRAGVFDKAELEMVEGIFRLDDMRAEALMIPRTEMVWLDADDTADDIRAKVEQDYFSQYPVCEGDPDTVLGIVHAKDLLRRSLANEPIHLRELVQPALFVPESTPTSTILQQFKASQNSFAFIIGEHGGVEGLMTVTDVLESIVGEFTEPEAVRREDGSWLVDGAMAIEEFMDLLDIKELPHEEDNLYHTVAGFILAHLGRIPTAAEHFVWGDWHFEVVDMDGKRIDKVLVRAVQD